MATVRFSGGLKDRILRNARNMFEKRETAAREARPDHSWGDRIYDALFSKYADALAAVPPDFLRLCEDINIACVGEERCNLDFHLSAAKPWPLRIYENNEYGITTAYGDSIRLPDTATWEELKADVARWNQGIKAVTEKRTAFCEQVATLLVSYTTLAPALKAWPPLWDLIPEDVKNKHKEIVVREKKVVDSGVDLAALTSTIVGVKIGG